MSSSSFYTTVLFSAIIFVLGCAIWLTTGSRQTATIVMVAVGAGLAFARWFYLDEIETTDPISTGRSERNPGLTDLPGHSKEMGRMPILSQEVNALFGLLDKAIALASQAITAPVERQVEIRAQLDGIVREIDEIKLRYTKN